MQPPKSPERGLLDSENLKNLQSIEVWLLSVACPFFLWERGNEVFVYELKSDGHLQWRRTFHLQIFIELLLCNRLTQKNIDSNIFPLKYINYECV